MFIFLDFSTDLVRFHLDFLKNIDGRSELFYDELFIRNGIRRYEHVWIPFVHKVTLSHPSMKDTDLAPPLGKKLVIISFFLLKSLNINIL